MAPEAKRTPPPTPVVDARPVTRDALKKAEAKTRELEDRLKRLEASQAGIRAALRTIARQTGMPPSDAKRLFDPDGE